MDRQTGTQKRLLQYLHTVWEAALTVQNSLLILHYAVENGKEKVRLFIYIDNKSIMRAKGRPYISYTIFILGWLKSCPKIARGCFVNTIIWKSQNFFICCIPSHNLSLILAYLKKREVLIECHYVIICYSVKQKTVFCVSFVSAD